ncbi:MAG TPA: choice-of-anchor D domain-containing protein [Parafilimonas sp.]|nr:choice-of-anchor D domain-containing protein [Parafilimonas sp.]
MKTANQFFVRLKQLFIFIIISLSLITCTKQGGDNNSTGTNPPPPPPPPSHSLGLALESDSSYQQNPVAETPTGGGTLPSKYILEAPSITSNQASEGACTSFAAAMTKSIMDHNQYGIDYIQNGIIYSPSFLYNQLNSIPGVCTSDAKQEDNLTTLQYLGDCTIDQMPYIDGGCATKPTVDQINEASDNKIQSWGRLNNISASAIKAFINNGQPVIIGFLTDAFFQTAKSSSDDIIWKKVVAPLYSSEGHAAVLYGWDDSKHAFKLINSYGNQWGYNGTIWVDYDFVQNPSIFYQAYTMTNFSKTNKYLGISGDLNFGNVQVNSSATKTLTLTNNSGTPINVSNVSIDAPYSVDKTNFIIAANGNSPLKVTFTPTAAGEVDKTLTITSDASNSPTTIPATGNGTQQQTQTKIISLSGTSLSFGNINIGQSSTQALTITNTGNATLTVNKINYSSSDFTGDWDNGPIAAGTSHTVNVTFKPSTAKTYSETLSIDCDATSGTKTVSLSGTGVQTQQQTKIVSLPSNLSFGNVTVGQTQNSTLTISNTGNASVTISNIDVPNGSGFSRSSYTPVIQAGGSENVTIYFSPTSVQSYSSNIIVYSDASNSPTLTTVTGNGISSGGSYTTLPPVGQYQDCDVSGSYYCSPSLSYTSGVIKARIVSVDRSSGNIVIEVMKCSGTAFNYEGELTVNPELCNSNGVSYGYVTFAAGASSVQIQINESNMTGTKTYYPKILQTSAEFATQPLTITFQ